MPAGTAPRPTIHRQPPDTFAKPASMPGMCQYVARKGDWDEGGEDGGEEQRQARSIAPTGRVASASSGAADLRMARDGMSSMAIRANSRELSTLEGA